MSEFISFLVDNFKKIKNKKTIISVIASICLFIVFLKSRYNENQLFISVEQVLLWIRCGIYNLIPKHIFENIYNILNSYYTCIFKIKTGIFIFSSLSIIWCHDRYLSGSTILGVEFKFTLWKRSGYYRLIKFTLGSGYIYYKIIEFISFGKTTISGGSYEFLIVLLIAFFIVIYLLQTLFYVPEEKE